MNEGVGADDGGCVAVEFEPIFEPMFEPILEPIRFDVEVVFSELNCCCCWDGGC